MGDSRTLCAFADTVGHFWLHYAPHDARHLIPGVLLNGLIPFFIFSSISNRSVGAIEANQGLFNYRPVKPIDTIIARALLETLIYVAVYILLMLIIWMAGEYFEITNFLQFVLTWSLLIILSCGVGLIFMVVGKTFPEMQRSCRYCLSRCISSPASCSLYTRFQSNTGHIYSGTH